MFDDIDEPLLDVPDVDIDDLVVLYMDTAIE